ncbi:MAG: hypothetical protein JWN33_225 [Candidatus Saccharibacteria bacterium]|nr:hypothetical protein [Candidatus Saccharibacteria bacterium]
MKSLIHRRSFFTPFGVISLVSLLALIGFFFVVIDKANAISDQQTRGRLLTVHDRGDETVILSEAKTIGEALKEADIMLDDKDVVEPAANETLVAPEYSVNIYRARPVVVIDGATKQKVLTAHQSAEQIVADAGVQLYPEDNTLLARSDDIIADGVGLQLTVDRAVPLKLRLHGTDTDIRTQGETVKAMLHEKGIVLGTSDGVSPSLDTTITSGMEVRVWREGIQTVTADEDISFGVKQIQDADHEVGYKEVQTPGQNGKRSVTYEINIQNGLEISRHEITSLVTVTPVEQVEIIGTKSKVMTYTGGGSKTEWLSASNIPAGSWGAADYIVSHESGWNPNAVNPSSGACGLAQALPCSKVPGNPYNPIDSLNWMNSYVMGRYGSWENAVAFKQSRGWY